MRILQALVVVWLTIIIIHRLILCLRPRHTRTNVHAFALLVWSILQLILLLLVSALDLVTTGILPVVEITVRSTLSYWLILPVHIQQVGISLLTTIAAIKGCIGIFSCTFRVAMLQPDTLRYLFVWIVCFQHFLSYYVLICRIRIFHLVNLVEVLNGRRLLMLLFAIWFLALIWWEVIASGGRWVLKRRWLLSRNCLAAYFWNVLAIKCLVNSLALRLSLTHVATWVAVSLKDALLAAANVRIHFIVLLCIEVLIVHAIKVAFIMTNINAVELLLST